MPRPIRPVPSVSPHRIEMRMTPEPNTGCWLWQGTLNMSGYGLATVSRRSYTAHRLSYVAYRGAIGTDVELDHLCRQRACVNPDHLEPVAPRVNWERGVSVVRLNSLKTHCKRGHALTPDNIYTPPRMLIEGRTRRECRACKYDPGLVHEQYLRKCRPGKSRQRAGASE